MSEDKFNELYQQIVAENNDEMELARKRAKAENIVNIIIIAIIVVINIAIYIGICCITGDLSREIVYIFVGISVGIFATIKHRGGKSKIEKYANEYKEKVVGKLIKAFNEGLDFKPKERNC